MRKETINKYLKAQIINAKPLPRLHMIRVFGKSYNKVLNSLINEIRHLKTKARLI